MVASCTACYYYYYYYYYHSDYIPYDSGYLSHRTVTPHTPGTQYRIELYRFFSESVSIDSTRTVGYTYTLRVFSLKHADALVYRRGCALL